jgi:hypothetical protein
MDRLSEHKVGVGAYADDQRVGSEDGLNEVHLPSLVVVYSDEWDVVFASIVDEARWGLIGSCAAARGRRVQVGMQEHRTDVAFVQRSAVHGTDMRCVVRSVRRF